jgi:hypothetical protein
LSRAGGQAYGLLRLTSDSVRALEPDRSATAAHPALPDGRGIARVTSPRGADVPTLIPRGVSGRYVVLGIEALALYSFLMVSAEEEVNGGAPGPIPAGTAAWERLELASARASGSSRSAASLVEAEVAAGSGWGDERRVAREGAVSLVGGAAVAADAAGAGAAGALAARAPEGSPALRSVLGLARRVSHVVDALRALNLTSFRVSQSTRLKVDGRTGHRSRLMFTVTHRF